MSLNKATFPLRGWVNRKGVVYWGTCITIGAAGAITTQCLLSEAGIVVTKQATAGQYLIQTYPLNQKGRTLVQLDCAMIGAPSATNVGQTFGWLTDNITAGTGAGNILLQAYNLSAAAAANIDSGNKLVITLAVDYGL